MELHFLVAVKLSGVILAVTLQTMVPSAFAHGQTDCTTVARDLATMAEIDQALRSRWALGAAPVHARRADDLPRPIRNSMLADRIHLARLKEIVQQCGWPRAKRDGAEAVRNAWLLAQHADHDLPFQRQVLESLKAAVADGDASMQQFAFLSDRIAVAEGRLQEYGTQLTMTAPCKLEFEPMDDVAAVQRRRKTLGLPTLEEYELQVRSSETFAGCPKAGGGEASETDQ